MSTRNFDLFLQVRQRSPFALHATLDCAAGELMALVGPSGSGKSTLLRMIAGLVKPQSGVIRSGTTVWADRHTYLRPQQRRVGYVPQNYGLFPHMHALANIESALHHLPVPERSRIAHEWLERMHLSGLAHRRPAALSGGQQQRVALARALAVSPSVLLLDEPFSAVDAATRERLYVEIVELRNQLAMPILLVTHHLDEALILADKITLLSHGKTLQSGEPEQIMAHPVNETAASLLGLRNIFDARVTGHDTARAITLLQLGAYPLEVAHQPRLAVGAMVRWMIADAGIRFRAISRQDVSARQNRIMVTVMKLLKLGDQVRLIMQIAGTVSHLQVDIPLRLASELALEVGVQTEIALRSEDIHIFTDADDSEASC